MDPTQNNNFDSTAPGGGGVGQPVAGGQPGVVGGVPGAVGGQPTMGGQPVVPDRQPVMPMGQSMASGNVGAMPGFGGSDMSNIGQPMMPVGANMMNPSMPVSPVLPVNPNMPVSSGTGDIILDNSAGKKSKKWWIVGGVVGLVVCIGVVVGLVFWFNISSQLDDGTKDYVMAFNNYANYLCFGVLDESDTAWQDISDDSSIFFEEEMKKNDENKRLVLNQLVDYYDAFRNSFMERQYDGASFDSLINDYWNKLKLIDLYYNNGIPTIGSVLETYNNGRETGVREYLNEKVLAYEDVGDVYRMSFSDIVRDLGDKQLALVEKYEELGCLVDSEIDYGCAVSNGDNGREELYREISETDRSVEAIINGIKTDLVRELYGIRSVLKDSMIVNGEIER